MQIAPLVGGALLLSLLGMPAASGDDPDLWLPNTLQAHVTHLEAIDAELAGALASIDSPDAATAEALAALREQANRLVARVTRALGDDHPYRATPLPEHASQEGIPEPHEFVAFDTAPELVSMEPPSYPENARETRVQGTVLVRVLVGTDGRVHRTLVIQSVPELDAAAVASARSARFEPARVGDEPVAVWMVIPIEFALH